MSFFKKNREQKGKTGPVREVSTYQWGKEDIRKGCRRVNML
jgi:hypothetical protein